MSDPNPQCCHFTVLNERCVNDAIWRVNQYAHGTYVHIHSTDLCHTHLVQTLDVSIQMKYSDKRDFRLERI